MSVQDVGLHRREVELFISVGAIQMSHWLSKWTDSSAPRVRVICFASAGSGSAPYQAWSQSAPSGVEVRAVQLPGRESRRGEHFVTDFPHFVGEVAAAVQTLSDVPLALWGHSMGAIGAFEVARQLARSVPDQPAHLFIAARSSPGAPYSPIHQLPDEQLLLFLEERYGVIPSAIRDDPQLLNYFLPIIRADLRLLSSYQFVDGPPLACPLTAMGGRNDHSVSEMQLNQWGRFTTGCFKLKMFDAGHFFPQELHQEVVSTITHELQESGFL